MVEELEKNIKIYRVSDFFGQFQRLRSIQKSSTLYLLYLTFLCLSLLVYNPVRCTRIPAVIITLLALSFFNFSHFYALHFYSKKD